MFDRDLVALVGAGLAPAQALHAIFAISHYVTGFVLEEQAEQQRTAAADTEADAGTADPAAHADILSELALATLSTAIRNGPDLHSEQAFDFGLRLLIDGMTTMLADATRHGWE